MSANDQFQLLHLSDLHIDDDTCDQSVVLDPLIERVVDDQKAGLKPEIIVVTGDIARTGQPSEYKSAKKFFDDLCRRIDLPEKNLFIVPGNHDLNHRKYPKSIN